MALVAGDDRILAAHESAVSVALSYLEQHATLRHRQDGDMVFETTGRLLFARFTEHASRELDPHLHTHVVVMNMTNRAEGDPMASLETRAMFVEQMTAGQVYRNELAHGLRDMGYDVEFDPRRGLFEIAGVPKSLITSMSQRAEQIDAHAREHGLTGQAARRKSFYETRRAKEATSLEDLRESWVNRLAVHRELVMNLRREAADAEPVFNVPDAATAARAMLFGIREAEGKEAVNNRGRLLRGALASHVGEVRLHDVMPRLEEHEERRKILSTRAPTGEGDHIAGRTTRRSAKVELALGEQLALALNDSVPLATPKALLEASLSHGLTPAQQSALQMLGVTDHRVSGLHGVAGAGKSTLVRTLKEAAGPDWTFIALAPTSSAAANLGTTAGIEARTVASLLASGGRYLDERHVLVLDEAGQLSSRQARRILDISRTTGARLILLGDNRQTGAIEQGKPFWLMQRLGLPTAELTESVRQETRSMKNAVVQARLGDYGASLAALDKVVDGAPAGELAERMVAEWTRLSPAVRNGTNILVLDNVTRQIVNQKVRETLKTEGTVAAEEARLAVLLPSGMSTQEKHFSRFYSGGQVVQFARDNASLGIARDTEYRVLGTSRDVHGRQCVRLVDEHGRTILWDPRLGRASQVNVFNADARVLSPGDRIQWRLVNHELGIRNADRGTVETLDNCVAMVRWDRDGRLQEIDLARHKTWDHGYAETVYAAQSKTYDRVYVLAPAASPLVTGQTYYTAITRARFGAKLWTEDAERLSERLGRHTGEKTSALEGLGRLDRASVQRQLRHEGDRLGRMREEQRAQRAARKASLAREQAGLLPWLAGRAQEGAASMDHWISRLIGEGKSVLRDPREDAAVAATHEKTQKHGGQHDR
jgi:ATP-dependent exoDNAse (exonuclease V) alpha subunit